MDVASDMQSISSAGVNDMMSGVGLSVGSSSGDNIEEPIASLYVGNMDPRVDEGLLRELFSIVGHITTVKVLRNRQTNQSQGYGFVDFDDKDAASKAMGMLNGRAVFDRPLKVNWASKATEKPVEADAHNIFVGDLAPEVTPADLEKAFSPFGSLTSARVMNDASTGRNKGYGFVAFAERQHAEDAVQKMNGEWLGGRQIRVNWAHSKTNAMKASGNQQDYWTVYQLSAFTNTTVYVGNIPVGHELMGEDTLRHHFSNCGNITQVRVNEEKGFAFVRFESHEAATTAIAYLNGTEFLGNKLRLGWGKDRTAAAVQQPMGQYYYGVMPTYYGYGYGGAPPVQSAPEPTFGNPPAADPYGFYGHYYGGAPPNAGGFGRPQGPPMNR